MKKKTLIIIAVVVVIGVLIGINLTSDSSKTTSVNSEKVKRQDLTEKVSASGRIQPQTKVDITAEVSGEIMALPVIEGQRVEQGRLLIVLDTIQIKADVDQARFSLDGARASLEGSQARYDEAKELYEREQSLFDKGHSSDVAISAARYAYLNAKASHEGAVANANVAEAGYDKQLDRLSKAKIVAPMAGILTFLDCEVGEIAPAQTAFTQGKTLMTIADLSVFEVEVEVDETEINKIALEQVVEIEVDAIPDTTFIGRVVEIGNTAILMGAGTQDQSTNFRVKVQFADANIQLRPGMSATVDITSAKHLDVMAIPFASVVMRSYDMDSLETARAGISEETAGANDLMAAENDDADSAKAKEDKKREDLKGVFVIRDGVARFHEIVTGIAGQKNVEVITGLEESDSVISGPYSVLRTIKDGDEVKIAETKSDEEDDS